MSCPICQSSRSVKNGLMHGLQRYKCKSCGCNYTRNHAHYQAKDRKRRLALTLYMEGLGFHAISDLLGVSHVSVINWVKRYGRRLELIRNSRPCRIMGPDESGLYAGRTLPAAGFDLTLIENTENTFIWLRGSDAAGQENKPEETKQGIISCELMTMNSLQCKKA